MLNLFGELTEWIIADQVKTVPYRENLFNPFPPNWKESSLEACD